jgi:hypothetical protein
MRPGRMINADFHGSTGEIRLPADACRLDQEGNDG